MRIQKNAKVTVHPVSAAGVLAVIALACCSLVRNPNAVAADGQEIGGTKAIYGNIPPDQIESLSTADRIKSVTARADSNMAIWEALEHGEKVECTDCIPSVAELLYNSNPRTREIAAWWLRRRIFGVFGPGQVYETTLKTLGDQSKDAITRAYAAEALGEFLAQPGIEACANAVKSDPDGLVRASAAAALGRLNDSGGGALAQALGDADPRVKLAAIRSAGKINSFPEAAAMARLANDPDGKVRRNAAEMLGTLRVKDGFDALATMARDADPDVRNAAAHSLGALHDPRARDVLDDLSRNDPNNLVRDQATIALRRL
ncbi:MAG: HEAT repeat domain-containing protein [Labilithrix sp.]|nr:HEAT repeat domain-containing protein [Labilithrix sp.]MCW5810064.1 HEAT repeat domain-containing protein [Labilithrix sp.]